MHCKATIHHRKGQYCLFLSFLTFDIEMILIQSIISIAMVHVTITRYVAVYAIDSKNVIFIIIAQWRLVLL